MTIWQTTAVPTSFALGGRGWRNPKAFPYTALLHLYCHCGKCPISSKATYF